MTENDKPAGELTSSIIRTSLEPMADKVAAALLTPGPCDDLKNLQEQMLRIGDELKVLAEMLRPLLITHDQEKDTGLALAGSVTPTRTASSKGKEVRDAGEKLAAHDL